MDIKYNYKVFELDIDDDSRWVIYWFICIFEPVELLIYYYILSLKFRFTCTPNEVGVRGAHRFYCKNTSKTLYLITLLSEWGESEVFSEGGTNLVENIGF